jgi:hypothetical protein
MQVVIQTPSKSWILLYQDPNPIVRGHTYQMDLQMKMDPTGNTGFVNVWRDGVEIASYHGQVGSAVGSQYYWKEGIYRGGSSQTMTADFSNTQISTGSAPAPTSTTTTSSSGTTATSGSTSRTTSGSTGVTDPRGTTSSGGTTTSSGGTSGTGTTRSTLSVANHYLSVSPGGRVPLGIGVTGPTDNVSLNISGLPKYESITDSAGQTFRGRSITLPSGDVNNLSLSSSYGGNGRPTASLTIRATDATGAPVTNGTQTITVQDPPLSTGTTTPASGTSRTPVSGWSSGLADQHGGSQFQTINGIQWFDQHPGFARVARTLGEAGASQSDTASGPGTGAGARAFALLNQMMAGDFEGTSHFAQGTTTSSASSQQQSHFLTRPLH